MWIVIDGLAGSGKSWLMTRLIRKEWKQNAKVFANYNLNFSDNNENITRWHSLDEIYHLTHGVIGIDEAQKLAGHWLSMPASFRDKISEHRRHFLDVYSNTQDFTNIHVQIRRNVHVLYRCQTIFRFPTKDRVKPILQMIRVVRKTRQIADQTESIKFKPIGSPQFFFISRYFTKNYYNTYADTLNSRFICKLKYEKKIGQKKGHWLGKIYSRDLVNQGKARI